MLAFLLLHCFMKIKSNPKDITYCFSLLDTQHVAFIFHNGRFTTLCKIDTKRLNMNGQRILNTISILEMLWFQKSIFQKYRGVCIESDLVEFAVFFSHDEIFIHFNCSESKRTKELDWKQNLRVSQICTFLSNSIFNISHNKFQCYLPKKSLEKFFLHI